jgi:uncharacterized membrane protein YjjP (DUF1212 family)
MLLSLSLSIILLSVNRLTISYSYSLITSYKLVSSILVLLPNLKVVTAVNSVVTSAFSGILFDFFYRNRGSNYITTPSRSTTVDILIG